MRCRECGRDIDAIGQDNVSPDPDSPLCEDCAGLTNEEYRPMRHIKWKEK